MLDFQQSKVELLDPRTSVTNSERTRLNRLCAKIWSMQVVFSYENNETSYPLLFPVMICCLIPYNNKTFNILFWHGKAPLLPKNSFKYLHLTWKQTLRFACTWFPTWRSTRYFADKYATRLRNLVTNRKPTGSLNYDGRTTSSCYEKEPGFIYAIQIR